MSDHDGDSAGGPLNRLARGSSLTIVGALCQQGALFGTTAIIARYLGSNALGQYSLAYATLSILGLLALCGFRAALTRFIATQLADRDPGAVRGTVRLCMAISVGGSVLIGGALLILAPETADLFHSPAMANAMRCVAIALPGATLRDSALAATQGWRTQRAFTMIGWIYEPLFRLALTAALIAMGYGVGSAYLALLIGTWAAAIAAEIALRRRVASLAPAPRRFDTRNIMSFSIVSWGTTLASSGLLWADTLLLGHLRTAADVGVYNAATRIVSLAVFVMAPINVVFAPLFAHHFHLKEHRQAAETYAAASNWMIRLSLPAFIVLVVLPGDLLRVFGDGYVRGASVTVALAVGQLVNTATGPCGTALNMAGKVSLNMVNNVVALVLNVALNLWWIPHHGIFGAAMAWSVSLILVNAARLIEVYWIIGAWPFGAGTAKALGAGVVAAFGAVVVRWLIGPVLLECVVGIGVTVTVYLAVTLAAGLEPGERAALRSLRKRPLARVTP